MLAHDLNVLLDWFKANQLSINLSNTVMISFWPDVKGINIRAGDYTIPVVTHCKFLGVFVDETLSWSFHMEHFHKKMTTNKHLLSTSKHKLHHNCLKKVFYSHIHSHLIYGMKVWGTSLSVRKQDDLYRQQKMCVCAICSAKSKAATDPLFKCMRILKLQDMIMLEQCKLGYQLQHKLLPLLIQSLFNSRGGKKEHHYPTRNKNQMYRNMEAPSSITVFFVNVSVCSANFHWKYIGQRPELHLFIGQSLTYWPHIRT